MSAIPLRDVPIDHKVGGHNRRDRAGKRYGKLTAIRHAWSRYWYVVADECGHEFIADFAVIDRNEAAGRVSLCQVCNPPGKRSSR